MTFDYENICSLVRDVCNVAKFSVYLPPQDEGDFILIWDRRHPFRYKVLFEGTSVTYLAFEDGVGVEDNTDAQDVRRFEDEKYRTDSFPESFMGFGGTAPISTGDLLVTSWIFENILIHWIDDDAETDRAVLTRRLEKIFLLNGMLSHIGGAEFTSFHQEGAVTPMDAFDWLIARLAKGTA